MLNILFVKNDNRRPSIMEASFLFTFCVILYVFFLSRVKKIKVQNWVTFFEAKKTPPPIYIPAKNSLGYRRYTPFRNQKVISSGLRKNFGAGGGLETQDFVAPIKSMLKLE